MLVFDINEQRYRRGGVYMVFEDDELTEAMKGNGSVLCGTRPYLVVSADEFNLTSQFMLGIPLSHNAENTSYNCEELDAVINYNYDGKQGRLLMQHMRCIEKKKIETYLYSLSPEQMAEIDKNLIRYMALNVKTERSDTVTTTIESGGTEVRVRRIHDAESGTEFEISYEVSGNNRLSMDNVTDSQFLGLYRFKNDVLKDSGDTDIAITRPVINNLYKMYYQKFSCDTIGKPYFKRALSTMANITDVLDGAIGYVVHNSTINIEFLRDNNVWPEAIEAFDQIESFIYRHISEGKNNDGIYCRTMKEIYETFLIKHAAIGFSLFVELFVSGIYDSSYMDFSNLGIGRRITSFTLLTVNEDTTEEEDDPNKIELWKNYLADVEVLSKDEMAEKYKLKACNVLRKAERYRMKLRKYETNMQVQAVNL